jgi:uncharacterized membrane protein YecN with MAPEG domain
LLVGGMKSRFPAKENARRVTRAQQAENHGEFRAPPGTRALRFCHPGIYAMRRGGYVFTHQPGPCAVDITAFAVVGLYAALNVLILLWFSIATSMLRRRPKVLIGDGGVKHLVRIMRGHANAIENMPMMMVLLLVAAVLGTPVHVLHGLGLCFTVGRAIHAAHFIAEHGAPWQRPLGFGLAAFAMLLTAAGVLVHSVAIMV